MKSLEEAADLGVVTFAGSSHSILQSGGPLESSDSGWGQFAAGPCGYQFKGFAFN